MKKIKINQIEENVTDKIDIFICSSSFEERCLSIPQETVKLKIPSVLIYYIEDLNDEITSNATRLKSLFGDSSQQIAISINNPAQTLKRMSDALSAVISEEKAQNFLMDITTFTHEGLLMIFRLLKLKMKKNDKLFLCYNCAQDYSYNEPISDNKWLSKGIKSIRSILGYPGLLDPSKKNHLVVLFGFEGERTRRLIDIYEYDLVSLAFGSKDASINDIHQSINESRHEELLSFYPNAKKFDISLIDANQTKSQLIAYLKNFSEYNTVIAPMNNKISSIGAGLAAMEKPETQLCYVTANQYNFEGYSKPSEDCYLFEVEF